MPTFGISAKVTHQIKFFSGTCTVGITISDLFVIEYLNQTQKFCSFMRKKVRFYLFKQEAVSENKI